MVGRMDDTTPGAKAPRKQRTVTGPATAKYVLNSKRRKVLRYAGEIAKMPVEVFADDDPEFGNAVSTAIIGLANAIMRGKGLEHP